PDRDPCLTVPCQRGLALIADSHAYDFIFPDPVCQLRYRFDDISVDFIRIVGYPSLLVDELSVLPVRALHKSSILIIEEGLRPLCALIYPDYISCIHPSVTSLF